MMSPAGGFDLTEMTFGLLRPATGSRYVGRLARDRPRPPATQPAADVLRHARGQPMTSHTAARCIAAPVIEETCQTSWYENTEGFNIGQSHAKQMAPTV
jgi:hypothetical protein